jgi:hypothetical protein
VAAPRLQRDGQTRLRRFPVLDHADQTILTTASIVLPQSIGTGESMWKRDEAVNLTARHRIFESGPKSWAALCTEATQLATELGKQKLINISLVASGGADVSDDGGRGVIVVWYWER